VSVVRSSSSSRFASPAVRKSQFDDSSFFEPERPRLRANFQLPSGFAGAGGGGGTGAGSTATGFAGAGAAGAAGAAAAGDFSIDAIWLRATSIRPRAAWSIVTLASLSATIVPRSTSPPVSVIESASAAAPTNSARGRADRMAQVFIVVLPEAGTVMPLAAMSKGQSSISHDDR
jgi:hypothetical protein